MNLYLYMTINVFSLYLFMVLIKVGTRFQCRRQVLYITWVAPLVTLFIFEIGSHLFPITVILLFYASCHCWNDSCLTLHSAFIHWDGGPHKLFPSLAWNSDPPVSDYIVPSVIAVSHIVWLSLFFNWYKIKNKNYRN
jgi:hypothetical protein